MSARPLHLLVFPLLWLCAACVPAVQTSVQPTTPPAALPPTPSAQATAAPTPPSTGSPLSSSATEDILRQVERLRGIEPRRGISYTWTSPGETAGLVREALLLDWPIVSLEREVRLLRRFGLSEPGMDLEQLMGAIGLDSAVIAPSPEGSLALSTDLAVADADLAQVVCGYERLLITQAFPDAVPGRASGACLSNSDACLASRALLEGDAALLAEQWLRTFGSSPSSAASTSPVCFVPPSPAGANSPGLVPLLTFPQTQGLPFARSLFLDAGWAGVDQAYLGPPVSTEQILHPERYPQDLPRPPEFPDPSPALGSGWTTEDIGTLGEWRTRLILQAHLDAEDAVAAAAGWDGDQYVLLTNADLGSSALVLLTRWDTVRDAHEFSGAFRHYGESRFGPVRRTGTALAWTSPAGVVLLDVGNDQTLWIEAPDPAVAAALREASGFPLY